MSHSPQNNNLCCTLLTRSQVVRGYNGKRTKELLLQNIQCKAFQETFARKVFAAEGVSRDNIYGGQGNFELVLVACTNSLSHGIRYRKHKHSYECTFFSLSKQSFNHSKHHHGGDIYYEKTLSTFLVKSSAQIF